MNKALSITAAAVGGALVGAAAALLFAPQKGSRTRRDIVRFVKENCPFVKDKEIDALADKIEDAIDSVAEKVNEKTAKISSK